MTTDGVKNWPNIDAPRRLVYSSKTAPSGSVHPPLAVSYLLMICLHRLVGVATYDDVKEVFVDGHEVLVTGKALQLSGELANGNALHWVELTTRSGRG